MDIGLKIKEFREKKGFSQQELADLVGISKQMISHYEKGENTPRMGTLDKIAKALNVKKLDLLSSESIAEEPHEDYKTQNFDDIKKERDLLKDKLLQQHEKYQALKDAYDKVKEELDQIKNRKQA